MTCHDNCVNACLIPSCMLSWDFLPAVDGIPDVVRIGVTDRPHITEYLSQFMYPLDKEDKELSPDIKRTSTNRKVYHYQHELRQAKLDVQSQQRRGRSKGRIASSA